MISVINIILFFSVVIYWIFVFLWFIKKQRFSKKNLIWLGIVGAFITGGIIGIAIYTKYQFAYNNGDELTRYIADYVYKSSVDRLGSYWLASFGFATVLTLLFVWLWRAKRGMVIDGADITLLTLGMLTVQWPNMLIMLLLLFVLVLLMQIVLVAFKKRTINDRLIITPAIPLAVILTFLYGNYLAQLTGLGVIRF